LSFQSDGMSRLRLAIGKSRHPSAAKCPSPNLHSFPHKNSPTRNSSPIDCLCHQTQFLNAQNGAILYSLSIQLIYGLFSRQIHTNTREILRTYKTFSNYM
jgi:hypothetical protein